MQKGRETTSFSLMKHSTRGKAKAVLEDVAAHGQDQETLALLKILALGRREVEEGRTVPAAVAFRRLRERRSRR